MSRCQPNRNRQGGRTLTHEREVDDDSPVIGEDGTNNGELGDNYEEQHQDAIAKNKEDSTRRDYRRWSALITNCWEEYCPVYSSTGARFVTGADFVDKNRFYFNGCYKKYLVCTGLNVKFLLKFWIESEFLKCGKLKSSADPRKHEDADL